MLSSVVLLRLPPSEEVTSNNEGTAKHHRGMFSSLVSLFTWRVALFRMLLSIYGYTVGSDSELWGDNAGIADMIPPYFSYNIAASWDAHT